MNFLIGLLLFVEALCAFLLIAVVLMQKPKNEGLGMAFGAEMGENLFGARASNVLVKITIWLGVIFLLNTTFLAMLYSRRGRGSIMDNYAPVAAESAAPQPAAPPMPVAPAGVPQPQELPAPVEPQPVAPAQSQNAPSDDAQPAAAGD